VRALIKVFEQLPANCENETEILIIRKLSLAIVSDSTAGLKFVNDIHQTMYLNPKNIWSASVLLEFALHSRAIKEPNLPDWVAGILERELGGFEIGLARLLQESLRHPDTLMGIVAIDAVLTAVTNAWCLPQSAPTEERNQWLIRFLDILIVVCASGDGAGLELGWMRGVSGLIGVWSGAVRSSTDSLVMFAEEQWDIVQAEVITTIPRWAEGSTPAVVAFQKQVS
jgi:hypothetical protein